MPPLLSGGSQYLIFIMTVVISSRYGGYGPGIFATLFCAFLIYFILPNLRFDQARNFPPSEMDQILFILAGLMITVFNGLRTSPRKEGQNQLVQPRSDSEDFQSQSQIIKDLHKTEKNFRRLFEDISHIAIFLVDPTGKAKTWCQGVEDVLGFSKHEFIGMTIDRIFVPPENALNEMRKELDQAATEGSTSDTRWHLKKDGSTFWAVGSTSAIYDSEGNLFGYVKVMTDATREKFSEIRVAEEEERLSSIINNVIDGILTIDEKGIIESANPAAEKIFGISEQEMKGSNINTLMPEPYASEHDRYLSNYLYTGIAKIIGSGREVEGRRLDGSIFPMDLAVGEFYLQGKRRFTGIVRDISERKLYEKALEDAKKTADAANSAKSTFLANMSHEIRTPLGAILGFSELLDDEEIPATAKSYTQAINRNAKLLRSLIDDILDLSKIEAGCIEPEILALNLEDLLRDVESSLQGRIAENNVTWNINVAPDVPKTIRSDPTRLRQILLNIAGNAIKFSPNGRVEMDVRISKVDSEEKGMLEVLVKDTGKGISHEEAGRLFQPFSQAASSTTRQFGGTGLGLVLARSLAKILDGDVKLLSSLPGIGSTFLIQIGIDSVPKPAHIGPSTPLPDTTRIEKKSAGRLAGVSVLLVEDNLDNQYITRMMLERAGATVELAENGQQGIESALAKEYSVVLMDIQMPVKDGYEATKYLREQNYAKPVIALTAHAMSDERDKTEKAGFDDYLTKPLNFENLVTKINQYTYTNSPSGTHLA